MVGLRRILPVLPAGHTGIATVIVVRVVRRVAITAHRTRRVRPGPLSVPTTTGAAMAGTVTPAGAARGSPVVKRVTTAHEDATSRGRLIIRRRFLRRGITIRIGGARRMGRPRNVRRKDARSLQPYWRDGREKHALMWAVASFRGECQSLPIGRFLRVLVARLALGRRRCGRRRRERDLRHRLLVPVDRVDHVLVVDDLQLLLQQVLHLILISLFHAIK